jgi:hypothetical protein
VTRNFVVGVFALALASLMVLLVGQWLTLGLCALLAIYGYVDCSREHEKAKKRS